MIQKGNFVFLPWVTLPGAIDVNCLQFFSIKICRLTDIVESEVADTFAHVLSSYRDRQGNPIRSCTIVLMPGESRVWDIPFEKLDDVHEAANLIALASLAEQRFYEQLAPHVNATMFRPILQKIETRKNNLEVPIRRRGADFTLGGMTYDQVVFQQPIQVDGTKCIDICVRFLQALLSARNAKSSAWDVISSSLGFFLLGHAEEQELQWSQCVTLSAIAFERLLIPKPNAYEFSRAFIQLWPCSQNKLISTATRVKPDPKYPDQCTWPIRQKWAQEFYERRSANVHRGPDPNLSRNWLDEQHIVVAAFAYPVAVKLKLAQEKYYSLSAKELGACDAMDHLLDSDWKFGRFEGPEWPRIISEFESDSALTATLEQVSDELGLQK